MITRARNAGDFALDVHVMVETNSARCDEVLVAQIDRPEEGVWWWHHGRFPGAVLLDAMLAAVSSALVDKWQVIRRGAERIDFLQHVLNPRYDCSTTEVGDGGRAIAIGLASAALGAPIGSAVLVYPSVARRAAEGHEPIERLAAGQVGLTGPAGLGQPDLARPFPFAALGLAYDGNEVRAFANASADERERRDWAHPFVRHVAAPLARATESLRNGAGLHVVGAALGDVPREFLTVDWILASMRWAARETARRGLEHCGEHRK